MRDFWLLPMEGSIASTGKDRLLILLDNSKSPTRICTKPLSSRCGRSWYLSNDICHAKGDASIEQSAMFIELKTVLLTNVPWPLIVT
jgi:hypothetical protein